MSTAQGIPWDGSCSDHNALPVSTPGSEVPRSTVETKVRGAARYLGPLSALCLSIFCYAATKCVSLHCLTSHPMQTVLC